MQFQVPIDIPSLEPPISYKDKLLLIGSCFTEHIGKFLLDAKFQVMQNPNGILFDPLSVSKSIDDLMDNTPVRADELFQQDEIWHSWDFHSRFSQLDKAQAVAGMNESRQQGHEFLQQAEWLVLTLGTSFCYKLETTGEVVANCHKVPANHFTRHLCSIEETICAFDGVLYRLFRFNPHIKVLFTVSPVRHIRDGLVDNTRSKARLIEAVHHLVDKFDRLYYFPAYEIMIDVLRDYRFYDIDLVHPNYAGTGYVLERFAESCISPESQKLMDTMNKITIARNHKPFNPQSQQHRQFLQKYYRQCLALSRQYPYLDFSRELAYFGAV